MSQVKNYGLSGIYSNVELGKGGPRVMQSAGVVSFRNAGDSAYAVVRGAEPSGANDLATKAYVDKLAAVFVKAQMKNDVARLPDDSGLFVPSEGDIAIVTTVGASWDTLKVLLVYRGAAWEHLFSGGVTPEGLRMTVTDSISGGTDTYTGDHVYVWDADGSVWVDVGPATALQNVTYGFKATLAFGDSSPKTIKANATGRAVRVIVNVTTAFDGTAPTLKIGDAGVTDRLMATTEVDLKTIGIYIADCYYTYATTNIIATYVQDSSTVGAATIEVQVIN